MTSTCPTGASPAPARHPRRLSELTFQAIRAWLGHRRTAWPRTPNQHVPISEKTAFGTESVSQGYLNWHLSRHGVSVGHIRRDRVLQEELTAGRDLLHLALVFNLSHTRIPAPQSCRHRPDQPLWDGTAGRTVDRTQP
jgi:hypothetical protein